jgi:electron-transferring-flavoprotein dehydrogenase
VERESMEFDVVIVGGGPAGLSAAIRLRQLAIETGHDISVCLVEKGSEIGAHILSGAVFEPRALTSSSPTGRKKALRSTRPSPGRNPPAVQRDQEQADAGLGHSQADAQ